MPELESLRSIARRLVHQYREKREQQAVAQLIEKLPPPTECRCAFCIRCEEPMIVPGFDFFLTLEDREFLRALRVRA